MALITRLWRVQRLSEVPGCPRAAPGPTADTSAGVHCRYNLLAPGEAHVGCEWCTEVSR